MENIEVLFSAVKANPLLVFSVAILATLIESFIPALPLLGIVMLNSALLGFFCGIIASLIGSVLGTTILFLLANKFSNLNYFKKLRNNKVEKTINWIKNQNYIVLYLCYASPFIPGCLVSISSGFSGKELKSFLPGMILGKLTMFTIAAYVGHDINGLIVNPERIVIVSIIVMVAFIIGKKLNFKMIENASA